jgi:MHS family proline/betaine transporter-like MFS transporter
MSAIDGVFPYRRTCNFIFATTIGNALEFFDFTVYSFVGVLISRLFFPSASATGQLLLVTATFGVGFLMRPIGGLVIGIYSDRCGRKAGLLLTIALMAFGSLLLGVAPTYHQAGIVSPILIVIARLLQGFSSGGEVGASTTLMLESAPSSRRGFYSSWQFASACLGVTLGALVTVALTAAMSTSSFENWGWRIPFLLGALIAPVGWYIRRSTEETLRPVDSGTKVIEPGQAPDRSTSSGKLWSAVSGILLVGGGITTSYTVTFFIPTYAIKQLDMPSSIALTAAVVCGFTGFIIAPLVGVISDIYGRKPLVVVARILTIAAIYPCLDWLNAEPGSFRLISVLVLLGILLALQMTPIITMIGEMFPRTNRVTSMSVVYGIGVSVFGGFAQFLNTWFIAVTGNRMAPAWYLSAILVASTLGLIGLRDRTHSSI